MFSIFKNDYSIENKGVMEAREIRQLEKKTRNRNVWHLYSNKNTLGRSQNVFPSKHWLLCNIYEELNEKQKLFWRLLECVESIVVE